MRRRNFLLAAGAAPLVRAYQESDAPPVFRLDVSLITVDAKVSARDGSDIGNLSPEDFIVFDEGQPQKVSHFGRFSTPVDVLLMLDIGAGMRSSLLELTPQVSDAIAPLRHGDRAGVMLFGDFCEVIQPLTTDLWSIPKKVVDTIYKDNWGRSSLVNEALVTAARYLGSEPATGRRTIVLITNGDAAGRTANAEVLRSLFLADAVTNVILVGPEGVAARPVGYRAPGNRQPDVTEFARRTGGAVIEGQNPAAALRRVIQDATTRYSLQYPAPPSEPEASRSIRVELSGQAQARYPGAMIRARSGYVVPK